jgi:ribonuclease HI
MKSSSPYYILFSDSSEEPGSGHWRFVLRTPDGSDWLEADDVEVGVQGERLELLTVVRGLEALDQPSRVTLITPSRYVREGIRHGLTEWRNNGWRWEHFGQMVPVKNLDLWQRVERALKFHQVDCRIWRVDTPHETVAGPNRAGFSKNGRVRVSTPSPHRLQCRLEDFLYRLRRHAAAMGRVWKRRIVHCWLQGGPCANDGRIGQDWTTG